MRFRLTPRSMTLDDLELYRARQKSNPLGKIRYLWNCTIRYDRRD